MKIFSSRFSDSGMTMAATFFNSLRSLLLEALSVSRDLFKIMIPIIVVVKVLQEFGFIDLLADPLSGIMGYVGLPGSMGLVWATAMINNIYSGIVVYVSLAPQESLTAAQTTVLATMILVAHSLPVELEIVRKSGPKLWFQALLRVASAFVLGMILHHVYEWGGWLSGESVLLLEIDPGDQGLAAWALSQIQNLAWIFLIILGLLVLMRCLSALGVTRMLIRGLDPVLRLLGIGKEAAPLTIVGMVMGIGYGGGLIMHEVKKNRVGRRDIFFALSLMGLSHSLIEDTLLMLSLGAGLSGILVGRVIFSLIVVFVLVRGVNRVSEKTFLRLLFAPQSGGERRSSQASPSGSPPPRSNQ
jgi:spore maturation protein SpmB